MRVDTRANGPIDWFPTLVAAVNDQAPTMIEWVMPGVLSKPLPVASCAEKIVAFPSAVSVHGGAVRRRLTPSSPAGAIVCHFIGGKGEVDLGGVKELDLELASAGADDAQVTRVEVLA